MTDRHAWRRTACLAVLLALSGPVASGAAWAQAAPDPARQSELNKSPGPRAAPARQIPVPSAGVSPSGQAIVALPYSPYWNEDPQDVAAWRAFVARVAAPVNAALPALRERLGVTSEPTTVAGVKAFWIQPKVVPAANRDRVLLHLHGGGYVLSPGEAGTREAVLMAAFGSFRILSIDYRMPPDAPAPAAMDDATSAYRELLKSTDPKRIAVFGTSTGGGMTLALMLRAKAEGLPMPAAIAPGTPWSDLSETGDTYAANEFVDSILVSWKGWLGRAVLLYANGQNLKDPYLSPIYGDMTGFPPAILTSGTRDLFLSNTVRTHRKLRAAGVEALLQVFEGQSHAQYYADPDSPETLDYHMEVARFFDRHLAP